MADSIAENIPETKTVKLDHFLTILEISLPLSVASLVITLLLWFRADSLMEVTFSLYKQGLLLKVAIFCAAALQLFTFLNRTESSPLQMRELILVIIYTVLFGILFWQVKVQPEEMVLQKPKLEVLGHSYCVFVFSCLFSRLGIVFINPIIDNVIEGLLLLIRGKDIKPPDDNNPKKD